MKASKNQVPGKLWLVSAGPGDPALVPEAARAALLRSAHVVSYGLYLEPLKPWIAAATIHEMPLTRERERAALALDLARGGAEVSLVSSGDIGVYGLASLAIEMLEEDDGVDLEIVPGITAATAAASVLGAPLALDFATLSLSDLMCPWPQIVRRAKALASCGMAVALYNPQSKQRREGIYEIADIFNARRDPATPCAAVRNARRPDQQIRHFDLGDLRAMEFDMLTIVLLGAEGTRRRRGLIYAPRGYLSPAAGSGGAAPVPQDAIWVFAGTSDGNDLAAALREAGWPVVVSAATDYGAVNARARGVPAVCGHLGLAKRSAMLLESHARAIVDATHPYAEAMSRQLVEIAAETGLPLLRFERPSCPLPEGVALAETPTALADAVVASGARRVFLAIGAKHLSAFTRHPSASRIEWSARVAPDPDSVEAALAAGIRRDRVLAMQGPFSSDLNETIWKGWSVDTVVTKESGREGGFPAKVEAASKLGISLLVLARPTSTAGERVHGVGEAVEWCRSRLGAAPVAP